MQLNEVVEVWMDTVQLLEAHKVPIPDELRARIREAQHELVRPPSKAEVAKMLIDAQHLTEKLGERAKAITN